MAVGRRNVDQHGVQGQDAAPEERRRVGQESGYVFGPALVDRPPRVGADEQGAVEEVAGHLGREVRSGALDVEVDDLDVLELGRARDECLEQHLGYRRGAMDVDLLAGAYAGDGLLGGNDAHAVSADALAGSGTTRTGTGLCAATVAETEPSSAASRRLRRRVPMTIKPKPPWRASVDDALGRRHLPVARGRRPRAFRFGDLARLVERCFGFGQAAVQGFRVIRLAERLGRLADGWK